jgi:hypothetical protein
MCGLLRLYNRSEPVTVTVSPIWGKKPDLTGLSNTSRCKLLYLVRWAGYEGTAEETSWITADELSHAKELVQDFHNAYPDKPKPSTA